MQDYNSLEFNVFKEKYMIQFFQKLFCFHAYEFDYDHEHGYTQECRKCGKDD